MSDPAQVQSGAHFGDHLHGVRPGGRSVCISSSETPLTGFHDNPASCHSGADGVRNFRPVYFRVLAPSGGGSPLVLKAGFCGFCACSSASRSFLRRPGHRPFPGPARSRGLASLWARLLGTSLPGRVFPGRRWPRSTGFGLLQPAGAARAQPGPAPAAAAPPSCFLRPGRPRQQCLGECGPPWAETASGASPGAGGARLRGAWRSGS